MNNSLSIVHPKKPKLTNGEMALLALIKNKIEQKQSITYDEVIDIYERHVQRTIENNVAWYNEQNKGRQWFTRCLGNLILKEKLVVIPVIDIE